MPPGLVKEDEIHLHVNGFYKGQGRFEGLAVFSNDCWTHPGDGVGDLI